MKCCSCKEKEAVFSIENKDYCFDCEIKQMHKLLSKQNVFQYPKQIGVYDEKKKHDFNIDAEFSEEGFLWSAREENGYYDVLNLASNDDSFEKGYEDFLQKVLDTIQTKTLSKSYLSSTWNILKKQGGDVSLKDKGSVNVCEDDKGHIYFAIDGEAFSPEEFADMLAPYKGMVMQYQLRSPLDEVFKENEELIPAAPIEK